MGYGQRPEIAPCTFRNRIYYEKEEAIEIAKKECEKRGWPWIEPAGVYWGLFRYTVIAPKVRGGRVWFNIRKKDGTVISAGMAPR